MRKTLIPLVVMALSVAASAAAQSAAGGDGQRIRDTRVFVVQQPPTPPRPRPAPRVRVGRDRDARAEQRETFTRTVKIGGSGILDISNLVGDIEVTRGSGSDVVVDVVKIARGRTPEEARQLLPLVGVDITSHGERAEIRTRYPDAAVMRKHRNVNVSVNFSIKAPQGTRVTARSLSGDLTARDIRGELSLVTTSGDVRIANAARVASAKSTSGDVEITNVDSDVALDAGTISGDVTVRQTRARRMELGTVSGRIVVEDVQTERLGAQTLSGDVQFSGTLAKGGRYELKSHSGDVRIAVDGGTGFQLEANSWSGDVHSDFALGGSEPASNRGRRRVVRGVVGDGSAVVNATTFSGAVHVVKK